MQVLIAGATGAGKTTLALEISKRYVSHIVSTSDIREGLRTVISQNTFPELFYSTYELKRFTDGNSLEGIFEAQALPILRATAAILNRHRHQKVICVAEGVHILPILLNHLISKTVTVLLVHQPPIEVHWSRLLKRAETNQAKAISKYENSFDVIRQLGEFIENAWSSVKLPQVHLKVIDNSRDGIESTIANLESILVPDNA